MISDELLNKFDRIEDLPVSEEMIGAYMEGNLDFLESAEIESVISDNIQLADLCQEISQNDSMDISYDSVANIFLDIPDTEIEIPFLDLSLINLGDLNEFSIGDRVAAFFHDDSATDIAIFEDLNDMDSPINIEDSHDGNLSSDDISFGDVADF